MKLLFLHLMETYTLTLLTVSAGSAAATCGLHIYNNVLNHRAGRLVSQHIVDQNSNFIP